MSDPSPLLTSHLPAAAAILNSIAAVLLSSGWLAIRARRIRLHRSLMSAAFAATTLFLAVYLVHMTLAGPRSFQGAGAVRTAYLFVLTSHMFLAALVPFLAVLTLLRGLRGRHPAHERLARWTLPIWLYVAVTGVAVQVFLSARA
jgi:putative membrane protein